MARGDVSLDEGGDESRAVPRLGEMHACPITLWEFPTARWGLGMALLVTSSQAALLMDQFQLNPAVVPDDPELGPGGLLTDLDVAGHGRRVRVPDQVRVIEPALRRHHRHVAEIGLKEDVTPVHPPDGGHQLAKREEHGA